MTSTINTEWAARAAVAAAAGDDDRLLQASRPTGARVTCEVRGLRFVGTGDDFLLCVPEVPVDDRPARFSPKVSVQVSVEGLCLGPAK